MNMVTLALAKQYTASQRLAYVESEAIVILPEETVIIGDYGHAWHDYNNTITEDAPVVAVIDGVRYNRQLGVHTAGWSIGNKNLISTSHEDTGEDWCINYGKGSIYLFHKTQGEHTFYVEIPEVVHPIDPKFIPALDSVTLNSPNGTQFKITVDDTGALTTTEVTP